MTIRRGERESSDEAETLWTSDDDSGPRISQTEVDQLRALQDPLSPSRRRRALSAPVHPILTDFGPHTLTRFLRENIEKAKKECKLDKGKGKEKERDLNQVQTWDSKNYRRQPSSKTFDRSTSEEVEEALVSPRRSARLSFAEDALKHLRGQKSSKVLPEPDRSARGNKSTNNSSSSPTKSRSEWVHSVADSDDEIHAETSARRTQRSKGHSAARSEDFSSHVNRARDRDRRNRLRRVSYAPSDNINDSPTHSEDSPPRFRKTPESLSHLSPQRINKHRFYPSVADMDRARREQMPLIARFADTNDGDSNANDDVEEATLFSWWDDPEQASIAGFLGAGSSDDSNEDDHTASDELLQARHRRRLQDQLAFQAMLQESMAAPRPVAIDQIRSFNYSAVVPERAPIIIPANLTRPASESRQKELSTSKRSSNQPLTLKSTATDAARADSSDDGLDFCSLRKKTKATKQFQLVNNSTGRVWNAFEPPQSTNAPPVCEHNPHSALGNQISLGLSDLGVDLWTHVTEYLSSQDIRNLRTVCSVLANELAPIMLRSVVGRFEKSMFGLNNNDQPSRGSLNTSNSVLARYGQEIHKFGIAFDYDLAGLCFAVPKVTEKKEQAWYGSYNWPTAKYPRFSTLKDLEDLVDDNKPLLKNSFSALKNVNELALSMDSGHGWLEGPDMSDLAVFEQRSSLGTKVFGQVFDAEDLWHSFGRNEYFKWTQQNSINDLLKGLATKNDGARVRKSIRDLQSMEIRDYDSFHDETSQHDFDDLSHTGGHATQLLPAQNQQHNNGAGNLQLGHMNPQQMQNFFAPAQHGNGQLTAAMRRRLQRMAARAAQAERNREEPKKKQETVSIPLQWPVIFNGYNLAADVGGRSTHIQQKVALPTSFPLLPGQLTEAQAQWLMETVWAQRAFLSAYTTAIIHHKQMLMGVHTLTIAKLSSGLLPSLAQREFWTALPSLRRLKILLSPDWRTEHMPGDKFHANHMPISPITAATKFAEFLQMYVAKLEKLSHLTIGYAAGGEHAVGLFARNQHVLPAPITTEPRMWITNHVQQPNLDTLHRFDHIRDLTFENCWFSPCMLESLMEKSRDTSLHTLVLDSVSMLSKHSTGIDGPLSTIRNGLICRYSDVDWLHEELPTSACWVDVLDNITPGRTMLRRRYESGMLDDDDDLPPQHEFRGNVQKIVLKSCGYAKISGVKGDDFNQNSLVVHVHQPMDAGLAMRKAYFEKVFPPTGVNGSNGAGADFWIGGVLRNPPHNRRRSVARESGDKAAKDGPIMMSMNDPNGHEWFGLGTLTQCVHPIEKRVLEQAWGMRFGWGNDIKRWASVEDGFFEGGTGRFSGVVAKDDFSYGLE